MILNYYLSKSTSAFKKLLAFCSASIFTKNTNIFTRQFYVERSRFYLVLPVGHLRNYMEQFRVMKCSISTRIVLLSHHTDSEDELLDDTDSFTDFHSESENLVANELCKASTIEEVVLLAESVPFPDAKFVSLVLVSLHSILREIFPRQSQLYQESLHKIKASTGYAKWCHVLETRHSEFPSNVLASILLSLSFITTPDDPVVVKYLSITQGQLPHMNLNSLSQFCSAMKMLGESHFQLVAPVVGLVCPLIDDCENDEDFKHLANCSLKGFKFASSDYLNKFARKVEEFVYCSDENLNYKTALKCLVVLFHSGLQGSVTELQQLLISVLIKFVPKMNVSDLRLFYILVAFNSCNTDDVIPVIEERVVQLLDESTDECSISLLLSCVSHLTNSLTHKLHISTWIREHPEINTYNVLLATLFGIFPVRNEDLIIKYFERCTIDGLSFRKMGWVIKEYLYYRRNESKSICVGDAIPGFMKLCLKNASTSVSCHEIVFTSAFLIANLNTSVPEEVLDRLHNVLPQLNIYFLNILSLGLSLAFQHFSSLPTSLQRKVTDLNLRVFDQCNELILTSKNLTEYTSTLRIISQTAVCASFVDRTKQAMLPEEMFHGYMDFLKFERVVPQDIIRMCKLINHHGICLPRHLDNMARCIVDHPCGVSVKVVANVLTSCYSVGYCPQTADFLPSCEEAIYSKFDILDCHDFLNAALSLGLFGALSHRLIHLAFSEAFLEKLEKEVSLHSFSQTRMLRLRFAVLNKVACLDHPEEAVPWFHENFLQAIAVNYGSNRMTVFEKEVYDILCDVLNGASYIQFNISSPYYYKIDFECLLDRSNLPVKYEDNGDSMKFDALPCGMQRVAVNLQNHRSYCTNMPRLRGRELMRERHLEILGYKVVHVPHFEWNSLQLSKTENKRNYLYSKIFQ